MPLNLVALLYIFIQAYSSSGVINVGFADAKSKTGFKKKKALASSCDTEVPPLSLWLSLRMAEERGSEKNKIKMKQSKTNGLSGNLRFHFSVNGKMH